MAALRLAMPPAVPPNRAEFRPGFKPVARYIREIYETPYQSHDVGDQSHGRNATKTRNVRIMPL